MKSYASIWEYSRLEVTALVAVRIEITWAPSAHLHGEVTALVAVRIEIV